MDPCCVEEVKEDIEFYIEANEGMEGGDDMDPYEVSTGHAHRFLSCPITAVVIVLVGIAIVM